MLEMESQELFAQAGLKPGSILLISVPQVARITGVSHRCPAETFVSTSVVIFAVILLEFSSISATCVKSFLNT
jgi:hypothetical protein